MILYFDSSALVRRYVRETGTDAVLELFDKAACIFTSRFAWLEITAAVARNFGALSEPAAVLDAVDEDFHALVRTVEVSHQIVDAAREVAIRHRLRAGDALQLASLAYVRSHDDLTLVRLVSADSALNAAAAMEGFEIVNPQSTSKSG